MLWMTVLTESIGCGEDALSSAKGGSTLLVQVDPRQQTPGEHVSGGAADCCDRAIIPSDAKLDAVSITSQQHGGVGVVPARVHAPGVLAAVCAPLRLLGRIQIRIS